MLYFLNMHKTKYGITPYKRGFLRKLLNINKYFKSDKTPEMQTTKNLAHCSQSLNLLPAFKCHGWRVRIYLWLLCWTQDH